MDPSMLVFNPSAHCHNQPQELRRTLDNLSGKVIGFIDNSKLNFNHLVDDLEHLLVDEYGVAAVIKRRKATAGVPAPDKLMKELAEQCDAVIAGSGD